MPDPQLSRDASSRAVSRLDPTLPLPEGGPPPSALRAGRSPRRAATVGHDTLARRLDRDRAEPLVRVAALIGAGALLGAAARRRTLAMAVAAAAALPLAMRGLRGAWPLPQAWQATNVVVATRLVIWRPRHDVYEAWRSFDRLPAVLRHLRCVEWLDEKRSRWVLDGPAGRRLEWVSELTDDEPGRALAWRSVDGSAMPMLGSLVFDDWRPSGREEATLLRADIRLLPPAGTAGTALLSLLRPVLERGLHEDLRRFKAFLEAGEVPTIDGQPSGVRSRLDLHSPF